MSPEDATPIRHELRLPGGRRVQVTYLDGSERWTRAAAVPVPPAREPTPPAREPTPPAPDQIPSARGPALPPAATAAGATCEPGLHVCRHCGGCLVHPLDWAEDAPERWRILMRCPDCGGTREGVFGRSLVERLDDELDRASGALLSDLRTLTQANMSEEIELFSRALQLDLIGPEDFAR